MNIQTLKTEITDDTLSRGYSGMSDTAVATDLNTVYRTRNKTSLTGSEVLNAINKAEFNAKTDAQKQMVWDIVYLGMINPFGIEADLFLDIFGASTTITTLQTLRVDDVSRATELGLGTVRPGHIEQARA